jgi:hypothetical protein
MLIIYADQNHIQMQDYYSVGDTICQSILKQEFTKLSFIYLLLLFLHNISVKQDFDDKFT